MAGLDPGGAGSKTSEAYKDLLVEEANSKKLKFKREEHPYSAGYQPASWKSELKKSDAIAWAKAKTIDVSHVETD